MTEPIEKKNRCRTGPRIEGGSAGARQWAVAILQVLAGEWTPGEGAQSLGVSLPRYYAVESRAMAGLVTACEPRSGKRRPRPEKEVSELKKQVILLQRECARKQALVRVAQRTAGIQAPAPKAKHKRRRHPTVRALRMADMLRQEVVAPTGEQGAVS